MPVCITGMVNSGISPKDAPEMIANDMPLKFCDIFNFQFEKKVGCFTTTHLRFIKKCKDINFLLHFRNKAPLACAEEVDDIVNLITWRNLSTYLVAHVHDVRLSIENKTVGICHVVQNLL